MRLGAQPCQLVVGTRTAQLYGAFVIKERHRHRYEFNREYERIITSYGMRFTGNSPDRNFVEIMELPDHPWFLACQFHPEFKSKPFQPHPLFASFIAAALRHKMNRPSVQPAGEGVAARVEA